MASRDRSSAPLGPRARIGALSLAWAAIALAGPGMVTPNGLAWMAPLGLAGWGLVASRPGRLAWLVEAAVAAVAWNVICSWSAFVWWGDLLFIGPGLGVYLAFAGMLLRRGPSLVVLSLGGDGALLASASPDGVWLARPPKVRVDSIVGAGDSFVGGFLSGWAAGRPLVEAFRLGIASGTATAITPGTELCHRADVRRFLPRVTITRVG